MNPIQLIKNEDLSYTVIYYGKEVGYIAKIRYMTSRYRGFRAVSVHGEIGYARNLLDAQNVLMGMHH
jgi:hypothetical protein